MRRIVRGPVGLIVLVAIVLLIIFSVEGLPFAAYRPGWEINAEIVAFDVSGEVTNPTPSPSPTPSGGSDWWGHYGPGRDGNIFKFASSSNVQYDFDYAEYGMPDIKATVGDIREETGAMPYATFQHDYGNFRYITQYHEYLFDVQVRTVAGVTRDTSQTEPTWIHETSMPYEYRTNAGPGGTRIGKPFDGKILVRFSTLPWGTLDYGPVPENYTFNGYWLGIMNSKIEDYTYGQAVQEIEVVHKGWVRNVQSEGAPLNMMQDDGTYAQQYTEIPWDSNKILDPDIKSSVIVEIPINLMAGAFDRYDVWTNYGAGGIVEVKPVDYFVTYTVRMEALVTKEYEYRDPATAPNPSPIKAPEDYVPYSAANFWDKYSMWIIIGLVVLVALAFFSIWIGLPIFAIIFGARR